MRAAAVTRFTVLALALACGLARAGDGQADPASDRARQHFIRYCSGCHLSDGSGSPSKGIPTMHGTLGRMLQVPGGREFMVQVPGVMNSPLKDREIADLLTWLVPYASGETMPGGTAPYTEAEVTRLRQSRPLDVAAVRKGIVERGRAAGIEIDATPVRADAR